MRTPRLSLAGMVILALLGGSGGMTLAQEDAAALEAPHRVTGQSWAEVWAQGDTGFDAERGVLQRHGWLHSERIQMDDPRLSGTMWGLWNSDITSSPSKVEAGTVALVNDQGSWVGTARGYRGPENDDRYFFLELTGTGSYAGHSALLRWHGLDDVETEPWDLEGFVFPGALPPYPDPVEVPTD